MQFRHIEVCFIHAVSSYRGSLYTCKLVISRFAIYMQIRYIEVRYVHALRYIEVQSQIFYRIFGEDKKFTS